MGVALVAAIISLLGLAVGVFATMMGRRAEARLTPRHSGAEYIDTTSRVVQRPVGEWSALPARGTQRALNGKELSRLNDNLCPFCNVSAWREGPHGGLSVNVYCTNCGGGLNLLVGMNLVEIIREPTVKEND